MDVLQYSVFAKVVYNSGSPCTICNVLIWLSVEDPVHSYYVSMIGVIYQVAQVHLRHYNAYITCIILARI